MHIRFLLFLLSIPVILLGNTEKKIYKKAQKAYYKESFNEAKIYYNQLLSLKPDNALYYYETGLAYWYSGSRKDSSLYFFQRAEELGVESVNPETYFYLALANHYNGFYHEAIASMEKFRPYLDSKSKSGIELEALVADYLQVFQQAISNSQTHSEIELEAMPATVNTIYHEYAPVFFNKDSVLLITSRRPNGKKRAADGHPYEKIILFRKLNGEWKKLTESEESKYLYKHINARKHTASVAVFNNQTHLFLYKKDKLWLSTRENEGWSKPQKLAKEINTSRYNAPSLCLSSDGNTLFFVAHRKGGIGGKDIYFSKKNDKSEWQEAEVLGPAINTPYDEDAPFLSPDGKTLYFSSKGHQTIGGYDIFKSEFVDGQWQPAQWMGLPYNSPADDIFFTLNPDGESGFLATSRKGGNGLMDVYTYAKACKQPPASTIAGAALFSGTAQSVPFKLQLANENHAILAETTTDKDGRFSFSVPGNAEYTLQITTPSGNTHKHLIRLPKQCSAFSFYHEIEYQIKENTEELTSRMAYFDLSEMQHDSYSQASKENAAARFFSDKNKEEILKENADIIQHYLLLQTLDANSQAYNFKIVNTSQKVLHSDSVLASRKDKEPVSKLHSFSYFFGYNEKELKQNKEYLAFIEQVMLHVKEKGKVSISIQSSASKVPTQTFLSNENLAEKRALEAKLLLFETLKQKGIQQHQVEIKEIQSEVAGPAYSNDAGSFSKYAKYQFVKLVLQ